MSLVKYFAAGAALIVANVALAGTPALSFKLATKADHVFHPICLDKSQGNKSLNGVDIRRNSPPLPWSMFYLLGAHANDQISCSFKDESGIEMASASFVFEGNTGRVENATLTTAGMSKYSLSVSPTPPAEGDVTVTIGDA